jgi:hypothetical protein
MSTTSTSSSSNKTHWLVGTIIDKKREGVLALDAGGDCWRLASSKKWSLSVMVGGMKIGTWMSRSTLKVANVYASDI